MATKKPTTKKAPAKKPQPVKDDRILVVIPYLAKAAQGREIAYAVEGWRRHFKEPHHIVIVGDDPGIQGDDITFLPCPRVEAIKGQYQCHIDHVKKFRKVREAFPDSKGFIYSCDDIYAVNDFTLVEVMFPKITEDVMTCSPDHPNAWRRDLYKTLELCKKNGLPLRNWVCHLPVWYEWDKLLAIYDKYDCDHISYVIENIYFNTYEATRVPLMINIRHDNLRCAVYRANPDWTIVEAAFNNKIWINNSIEGWTPQLDKKLSEYYEI